MHFRHSDEIWRDFPELVPGVLRAEGISANVTVDAPLEQFHAIARSRLAAGPESELPEIAAWRRVFSRMGLKPTQYRCAAEALLRRFRKEGALPRIHPLIDLCNAVSLAFAIPVAVFDLAQVDEQGRVGQPQPQHRDQALPAGEDLGVLVCGQRRHGVRDRARRDVVELCRDHRASPFVGSDGAADAAPPVLLVEVPPYDTVPAAAVVDSVAAAAPWCTARHTRSGLAGMAMLAARL